MKSSERMNYDKMFESLRPVNGTVAGDKVNNKIILCISRHFIQMSPANVYVSHILHILVGISHSSLRLMLHIILLSLFSSMWKYQ